MFITLGWSGGSWPVSAGTGVPVQFGLFYLAVFSLYYVLCTVVSPNSAFWSTLLMGMNPWFLTALGEASGTGAALVLVAAAGVTAAARARRGVSLWMVGAGVLFAASVRAHGFSLLYLPVLGLALLYLNYLRHKHPMARLAAWFAAGFLLGAVLMFSGSGLFSEWIRFMPLVTGGSHPQSFEGFTLAQLPSTFYLHGIIGLWLLSAILLFRAGPSQGYSGIAALWSQPQTRPYGFCLSVCFLYGLIVMTLEGGWGWNLLGQPQWTVFYLPAAAIGLAGVLERAGLSNERMHKHASALFFVSLTLVSYPALQGVFAPTVFGWGTLVLWALALGFLMLIPALKNLQARMVTMVALILLAGFLMTGPDNPVFKKAGASVAGPQLTQHLLPSYK